MTTATELSILVVDDRPENLVSMQHLLQQPGLEILTADSGNAALAIMLEADLALVLLDVQMPGMNGFEVAELMRRNERTRQVPIIFVTALNKERRQVFSGYEAGAVDYLFKPVDPFVLRSKVAVFLEMKRAQLARERLVRELNGAYNRLQELSDRKTDFLSAASHELRSPLTVIKEYCGLVHEGIVGEVNEEQQHCMHVALRNCNRLAVLVDNLLDLNAIETGHVACRRRHADLAELLETCREDFAGTRAATQRRLVVDLPAGLPPVLADPALVNQVLVNLVGNALKFTPTGGTVTLRARPAAAEVRVEVADTGPGIPVEDRGRVFEKFVRLTGDDPPKPGSGLGLAIARRLVEMQDGAIGVTTGSDGGSVFHFTLPVHTDAARLRAFVTDGSPRRENDPRCLVLVGTASAAVLGPLEEHLRRALRRSADRLDRLRHGGREVLAVMLAGDRDGALTFLARLEGDLAAERRELGPVSYLLHELDDSEEIPVEAGPEAYRRLDLDLAVKGADGAAP